MFWKRSYKNINNAESIDRAAKEFVSSHDLAAVAISYYPTANLCINGEDKNIYKEIR